jgi:peptidyl-prolyl cis-trans isomerase D
MLQTIRDKTQGIFSKIVVGLLIAVFGLWGVERLTGNITQSTPVLVVNGDEILATEIDKLAQKKTQDMIRQLGNKPDLSKLDESQFRESAVNELIQRKLLEQSAEASGMVVSANSIDRRIRQTADFQIDGVFNKERAALVLQGGGFTPARYRSALGQEILLNQQLAAYTTTGFATQDQLSTLVALVHQKRSLRYFVVPAGLFTDAVKVSDQDIQDYYQQHQNLFQQAEQVSIEYLELNKDKLMDALAINEEQVKAAYQEEVAAFKAQTERRASHILWPATTDAELAAARKEAAAVKARLDKGEDFAKLAKEFSKDTDSAQKGGDVGFTTGSNFTEAFETALQKLAVNQVSEPVQSEFGIHLIKLTAQSDTKVDPYEARKDKLLHDLKQKAADAQFTSKLEELKTLSFESPDLAEPASRLQLSKQSTGLFGRSGGTGISAEKPVINAAFSPEVKDKGLNSEVVTLDDKRSIVLHVLDHQAAQVRALDVVRGEVEVTLRMQKAKAQAGALADTFIKGAKSGENIDALLVAQHLGWITIADTERAAPKLNPEITDKVFTMAKPQAGKTVVEGFALQNGDYAVIELQSVKEGTAADSKEGELDSMRNFVSQQSGATDFASYMKSLEARAKIKGRESQLAAKDPLL